jgi:hypothetical protein
MPETSVNTTPSLPTPQNPEADAEALRQQRQIIIFGSLFVVINPGVYYRRRVVLAPTQHTH